MKITEIYSVKSENVTGRWQQQQVQIAKEVQLVGHIYAACFVGDDSSRP